MAVTLSLSKGDNNIPLLTKEERQGRLFITPPQSSPW